MDIRQAIEKLLADPSVTNYQISKATGVSQVSLNKFARGESNIDNMPLGNALKLYDYYTKLKEEGAMTGESRDLLFGRMLGVLNVLGERLFEKGKPSIDEKSFKKFPAKPASTFERLHKEVMDYSHKFGEEENRILALFDELLSELSTEDFNDSPLGGTYLLGYYRQNHELAEYKRKQK
ncbi:type I-C CRISPR-associated protein Cas8c/Csd1 [Robertmurraya sp. DFI.2.37]|uniref:type I-C CRISPR-associated protein Cas8c/Csd1 n=1 Tax=Robertmurraya sp. DFI.2.37 TaxID=3031819 RepID=UPI001248192F|nr:type I-C CRISPR-associated protein Cas8c/Csd1 [Robertmurraya sp. DFI.2.37]MDF1510858.1 type I-C CRISPR-associated protein Cas8c/Csd1 [Robertmurraya sp. DFI.2.37]